MRGRAFPLVPLARTERPAPPAASRWRGGRWLAAASKTQLAAFGAKRTFISWRSKGWKLSSRQDRRRARLPRPVQDSRYRSARVGAFPRRRRRPPDRRTAQCSRSETALFKRSGESRRLQLRRRGVLRSDHGQGAIVLRRTGGQLLLQFQVLTRMNICSFLSS